MPWFARQWHLHSTLSATATTRRAFQSIQHLFNQRFAVRSYVIAVTRKGLENVHFSFAIVYNPEVRLRGEIKDKKERKEGERNDGWEQKNKNKTHTHTHPHASQCRNSEFCWNKKNQLVKDIRFFPCGLGHLKHMMPQSNTINTTPFDSVIQFEWLDELEISSYIFHNCFLFVWWCISSSRLSLSRYVFRCF